MPSADGSLSHIQSEVLGEASRLALIDRARQAWETGWSLVVEAVKTHVAKWAANDDDFASLPAEIAALKSNGARSSPASDRKAELTKAHDDFLVYYRQIAPYCADLPNPEWPPPWDVHTKVYLGTEVRDGLLSYTVVVDKRLDEYVVDKSLEFREEFLREILLLPMQQYAAEWRGGFDLLQRVTEEVAIFHADFDKELCSLAGKLRGELPYEDCQAEARVFIEKFAGGRDHLRWANTPLGEGHSFLEFSGDFGPIRDEPANFTWLRPSHLPTGLSEFWFQVVQKLPHLAFPGGTLRQQAKMREQLLEAARDYLDATGYVIPDPKSAKPTEAENTESSGNVSGRRQESSADQIATIKVTWQEAADKMLGMLHRNEPFTSQRKLGKQIGCSPSTINTAIKETEVLHEWADIKTVSTPKAQSLTEVVIDKVAQHREADPADFMSVEDVDTILDRLVWESKAEDRDELRKQLSEKTPDERRKLASVVADDPYVGDKILGRKA